MLIPIPYMTSHISYVSCVVGINIENPNRSMVQLPVMAASLILGPALYGNTIHPSIHPSIFYCLSCIQSCLSVSQLSWWESGVTP